MRGQRAVGAWRCWAWAIAAALAVAACTEDPPETTSNDAGPDGSNEPDMLPRRDGGNGFEGDPIPPCSDRFSPTACPAGKVCDIVISRAPTDEQFTIFTGCVDTGPERVLGEPCVPFGGFLRPIEAEGLVEEAYSDPCGPGLYCAADPTIRNLFTCQAGCNARTQANQSVGLAPRGCASDNAYCTGAGPFEEVCVPGDDCDPSDPTSCGAGQACYLRFNHTGLAALSVCLPVAPEPLEDGAECLYLNHCMPGASCWGPSGVASGQWDPVTDWVCRRACAQPGGGDAGIADDDGGVPSADDGCPADLTCTDLGSAVDYGPISAVFGQCE